MLSHEKSLPEMLEKPLNMESSDITMDDLLAQTTNLSNLEEEGWEVIGAGGSEVVTLCAMGRWCSNRPISRSLLKTIFGRVWGIAERNWGVEIKGKTTSASFLVFSFKSTQDLNRILAKNPWFLNNGILIMEKFEGMSCDWNKVLTRFPLSGRILNLPNRSITKGNMDRLARYAGQLISVQNADIPKIASKGYFTFKVWHDIATPLCPGFLFPYEEPIKFFDDGSRKLQPSYGSWLKVNERYECNPSFIQDPCGNSTPNKGPPSFPEKRNVSSRLLPTGSNLGAKGASGESSHTIISNPSKVPLVSSYPSFNINSGILGKGKNIEKDHKAERFCIDLEAPNYTKNSGIDLGLGVNITGQGSSKRDGSWREESFLDMVEILQQQQTNYTFKCQPSPLNNHTDPMPKLIDVPISYDHSFASLKKMEGPSKRRKVIPKRSKNKGGNGTKEVMMEDEHIEGWKVITEPESLLSRVLKALYFPNETFFEAKLGHFGSSVWKGLLWGRDLLTKGYRWCVGDGRKIRINEDPWLPRQIPFQLRTKVPIPQDVTLNSLLTTNGDWKINEVSSWFHNDDIPWVLGIIPSTHQPDWITWGLNNNGHYSVASGYKLRFLNPEWAACSNNSKLKAWWKFIWGSRLTPKMKNFIWKVFNHWIPTKMQLRKRGMSLLANCDRCLQQEEDIPHALWGCPKVQKIWKQLGYSKFTDLIGLNASAFLWWQWEHLSKEEFIRFVETIEHQLGQQKTSPSPPPSKPIILWQPPPKDFFIINTDASLVHGQEGCGISAIIRNEAGGLIVAETVYTPGCMAVNLAEAAAILLGLKLAIKWSISNVWVASDSKTMISAIINGASSPTDWGHLVQTIIQLKTHFQSIHFLFFTRNCNKVANSLAKWSRMTQKCEVWTDSLPSCAAAFLIADVPSVV
uniref:RNase H type-1 domain-containing protein n=1 Tax=Cannabis sativa TaxID=3483 RepID=A0A803PDB4_CANSA